MDLSFKKHICAFLAFVCMMLSAASCIYDDIPEEVGGALRFNVTAAPATKLSYEGFHTSFTDTDVVGCVIAAKSGGEYTYKSTTAWQYQSGFLSLLTEDDAYVEKHEDHDMAENGYVSLLDEEMEYSFFFYYPYDPDNLPDESDWKSYTVSVGTDFSTSGALSASDHLWTKYDDQSKYKEGLPYEKSLTFEKKTASVEVHLDHGDGYAIDDVWIDMVEGTQGLMTKMEFDLTTGAFTALPVPTATSPAYDGRIIPGTVAEGQGSIHENAYRMIMVPQQVNSWRLHAIVTEDGSPEEYNVHLEDKLKKLEEGKLYIFHIAKAGKGSILIKDWDSGSTGTLEPDFFNDLDMNSDRGKDPETQYVIVKSGETVTITGTDLDLVSLIEMSGAEVTEFACSKTAGYNTNGYLWQITFTLPETARDGKVYIDTEDREKASPGSITVIKPVATGLEPSVISVAEGDVTLYGTDLDLVRSITFAGGATAVVKSCADDGTWLTVTVPEYAHSGELQMNVKNGTVQSSGQILTISAEKQKPHVDDVTGIFKYDQANTITVTGENLNLVTTITVSNADDWNTNKVTLAKGEDFTYDEQSGVITFIYPEGAGENNGLAQLHFHVGEEHADSYVSLKPAITQDIRRYLDYINVIGENFSAVKYVYLNRDNDSNPKQVDYSLDNDNEISLVVWQNAGVTGEIWLEAKHGYVIYGTYDFTPIIDRIEPNPAKIGQSITLYGSNLDLVHAVGFYDGADHSIRITSTADYPNTTLTNSSGAMTLTVPYGAKSGSLELICVDWGATTTTDTPYLTIESALSVVSIDNASRGDYNDTHIVVRPGEDVVIHGSGLDQIDEIKVGEVTLTRSEGKLKFDDQQNTLTFTFPDFTGSWIDDGTIVLVTAEGDLEIPAGTYELPDPEMTSVDREGSTVVFHGTDLDVPGSILLNGEPVSPQSVTASEIRISRFVTGISAGNLTIESSYDYEKSASMSYDFTPVITSISSNSVDPGQELTIYGRNLDLVDCVIFGDIEIYVRVTPVEGEENIPLTFNIPADAENRSCELTLRCIDYSTRVNSDSVTISALDNKVDIWTGQEEVSLDVSYDWASLDLKPGDQLVLYTDASVIENEQTKFSNLKDWSFNLQNSSGNTLAGAQNPYKNSTGVMVTLTAAMISDLNANGLRIADITNCYMEGVSVIRSAAQIVQPEISSITRNDQFIYINGSNLNVVTSVNLNNGYIGNDGWLVNGDGTCITIDLSRGGNRSITGNVIISYDGGTVGKAYDFAPAVSDISPTTVSFGETVTVTGTNLDLVQNVTFVEGGVDAKGLDAPVPGTTLTFVVPEGAQTGKITLSCIDGGTTKVTPDQEITIGSGGETPQPTVSSIKSGRDQSEDVEVVAKAGEQITISGSGLGGVTAVKVNGTSISVTSDGNTIVFTAPDVSDGPISLVTSAGETVAGTYVTPTPTITGCVRAADNKVVVSGTDLDLVKTVYLNVTGNSDVNPNFTLNGSNQIVLEGSVCNMWGSVRVVSRYNDSNGSEKTSGTLDYNFRPVITRITDGANPITWAVPGQQITIEGQNLDLVRQVTFNNSGKTVDVSPTLGDLDATLTVTVPEGTEGSVSITLQDITGQNNTPYEFEVRASSGGGETPGGAENTLWTGNESTQYNRVPVDLQRKYSWNEVNLATHDVSIKVEFNYESHYSLAEEPVLELYNGHHAKIMSIELNNIDESQHITVTTDLLEIFKNTQGFKIGGYGINIIKVSVIVTEKQQN